MKAPCKPGLFLFFFLLLCILSSCDTPSYRNISSDQYVYSKPEQYDDGFAVSSPSEMNLNQTNFDGLVKNILDSNYGEIDSVLIYKNGNLILEEYFNRYNKDTPHDLRSATKSITSMLIGIAIEKGFIADTNEPVYPFFEQDYVYFENWTPRKYDITIEHLLNMASGLDCIDGAYFSEGHEDQMYQHRDWYRYILDVKLINMPGEVFRYCTGGVNLLGGIIRRASRKTVTEFSHEYLFSKLGITNYRWSYAPNGTEDTGGHLYLTPRDFLKMGVLFLNKGNWNGEQIINTTWMETSREKYFSFYGYLWWKDSITLESVTGNPVIDYIEASGNGGQKIYVFPTQNTVITINGSNYNQRTGKQDENFRQESVSAIYTP